MTLLVLAVAVATGACLGVFGTVFVLVAVDSRRWHGAPRRPVPEAVRHGLRGGLYRATGHPLSRDVNATIAGQRELERRGARDRGRAGE